MHYKYKYVCFKLYLSIIKYGKTVGHLDLAVFLVFIIATL